MAKVKAGEGKCHVCAREVVWKSAESGTFSYTCQHCDFRGYAPARTEAAKLIAAQIGATGAPQSQATDPAPAPTATVPPSPPPKAQKSGNPLLDFALGVK